MASNKKHLLFVYGTLKRGHGNNHFLLSKAKFIGEAVSCEPSFVLMDWGGFPACFAADKANGIKPRKVQGEVFEVDEATLASCDRLEGHPNWYRRTPIQADVRTSDDGDVVKMDVEIYLMSDSREMHGILCEQGLWPRPIPVAIP